MQSINFRHWMMALLVTGILFELGFLYSDTLVWMKTAWFGYTPDRAGILVPPLFIWMAYTRLKQRSMSADDAPFAGFLIIFCCLAAFMSARMIDINFIQALSLIGIGFGLVVFFGGIHLGGAFLFPFAFLTLMIPSVSYLIESIAGAFLREAVLLGVYFLLKITGGAWQLNPAGLINGEAFLQIGFSRGGVSSLLFLLIVHFAITEYFLKREARKFFFMVHFPLYFIVANIFCYTIAGLALTFKDGFLFTPFSFTSGWLTALVFIFLTSAILFLAGRAERKRDHVVWGGK